MNRLLRPLVALLLLNCLVLGPQENSRAQNGEPSVPKAPPAQPDQEDREVIEMLELLEMMQLLQDMEIVSAMEDEK